MHTILVCVAEAWAKKFKSLSENPKWTGRTPSSAQDDHVSTAVLRSLHSHGENGWDKVDDMWQAKCMPLWGLVRPTNQSLARSSTDTYGQWAFGRLSPLLQTKAARVAGREDGGSRPLRTAAGLHFRGELEAACSWTEALGC